MDTVSRSSLPLKVRLQINKYVMYHLRSGNFTRPAPGKAITVLGIMYNRSDVR